MTKRTHALVIVCWLALRVSGQTPNIVLRDGDFPAANWTSRVVVNAGNDATFTAQTKAPAGTQAHTGTSFSPSKAAHSALATCG